MGLIKECRQVARGGHDTHYPKMTTAAKGAVPRGARGSEALPLDQTNTLLAGGAEAGADGSRYQKTQDFKNLPSSWSYHHLGPF